MTSETTVRLTAGQLAYLTVAATDRVRTLRHLADTPLATTDSELATMEGLEQTLRDLGTELREGASDDVDGDVGATR